MNDPYKITPENLLRTLPDVLRNDESMYAVAASVADVLSERPQENKNLNIYGRIDQLPEPLLDILAHDFKVDWWDMAYRLEEKRQTLNESWHVRKTLGTPYAVKTALRAIYKDTIVQEWFAYSGEPYKFKVLLDIQDHNPGTGLYAKMIRSIGTYKSLRSHLELLAGFFRLSSPVPMRFQSHMISLQWAHAVFGFGSWTYFDGQYAFNSIRRMNGLGESAVIMRGSGIPEIAYHTAIPVALFITEMLGIKISASSVTDEKTHFTMRGYFPPEQKLSAHRVVTRIGVRVAPKTPGIVIQDTMWYMDGTNPMDGVRRFNAAIVRSEI